MRLHTTKHRLEMCQLAVAALALVQPRGSRLLFCLNGALKRVYQFLFATRRKEICKYVLRQFSTAEKKVAENFFFAIILKWKAVTAKEESRID